VKMLSKKHAMNRFFKKRGLNTGCNLYRCEFWCL